MNNPQHRNLQPRLLLLATLLFTAFSSSAHILSVYEATDTALRQAIAQAVPGDIIYLKFPDPTSTNLLCSANTLALTNGELVIDKDLCIIGLGPTKTLITGGNLQRIFKITGGPVFLSGLTLSYGEAKNYTPPSGGAIFNNANLTLSNCFLLYNRASPVSTNDLGTNNLGGAIYNSKTLVLGDCTLAGNACTSLGGALFNSGSATIVGSLLEGNSAWIQGGAIDNTGCLSVSNSVFRNNSALSSGGGGLGNVKGALATLQNCHFTNNSSTYYGGGALLNFGTLCLTDCSMAGNSVADDTNDRGVISGGGAIYNAGGSMAIYGSVIGPANKSRRGGGILNIGYSSNAPTKLQLVCSTIYSNEATRIGGGLLNYANGGPASASLTNVTITRNWLEDRDFTGGAIDNSATIGTATVNLQNCTVVSNFIYTAFVANGSAGIFCGNFRTDASAAATINIANTILANNHVYTLTNVDNEQVKLYYGRLNSLGHNLCSKDGPGLTNATDLVNRDPRLGSITTYGLLPVYPLLGDSPAIDAGDSVNAPLVDERGLNRPVGGTNDIGAFENSMEITRVDPFALNRLFNVSFTQYRTGIPLQLGYRSSLNPSDFVVASNFTSTADATRTVTLSIPDGCAKEVTFVLCGPATSSTNTIVVTDKIPPVITVCASNQTLSSCAAILPDLTGQVTASDNCGNVIITQEPAAGSQLNPGTTAVVIAATDTAGNTAACTCLMTVPAPVFNCPTNIVVTIPNGGESTPVEFDSNFQNNCAVITHTCTPQSGSPFPLGTTPVTCYVLLSQTQLTCNFDVVVNSTSTNNPSSNRLSLSSATTNQVTLRFLGTPGGSYVLERSQTLSTWTPVADGTAPANGVLEFIDAAPPQRTALYRVRRTP